MSADYFSMRIKSAERDFSLIAQWLDFRDKQVLDLGSGSGGKCIYWSRLGAKRVNGIDVALDFENLNAYTLAAFDDTGNHTVPAYVQGDGGLLPFASDTFDIITMHDVMEHLEKPHEVLCECRRVLRPQGRMSILTPHYYGLSGNHLWNYLDGRAWRYLHPHLVLPKNLLKSIVFSKGRARHYSSEQIYWEWNQFSTLNRLRLSKLHSYLAEEFEILEWSLRLPEEDTIRSVASWGPLSEIFSYGVVAVVQKRTSQ